MTLFTPEGWRSPVWPDWFTAGKNTPMTQIDRVARGLHPTGYRLNVYEIDDGTRVRCGTCKHLRRKAWRGPRVWLKCLHCQDTNGPGSDIRAKWRGCEHWEADD